MDIIKIVGKIADELKVPAYIVGGPVRDKLLDMPNIDLDFVVEGDGIKFARVLNKKLEGKLTVYKAFGTATVELKGKRIDIVTARKETYARPAAYPTVKPGTIKDDLFRRDFTINAMAIAVNKEDFGKLVDFYGGQKDLKKRVIRVMHDKSFIDDPTRVFRAVRFAVRFGFRIEPHTKRLIKEAVSDKLLAEVNKGRIKKEIELLLKEKNPRKCLETFAKLA
jgi:tRNA nucleotidyltransferase (CCA-adding enzyme)